MSCYALHCTLCTLTWRAPSGPCVCVQSTIKLIDINQNRQKLRRSWAIVKTVSNTATIAAVFNKNYVNVGTTLATCIPASKDKPNSYVKYHNKESLFLLVRSLRNPGWDDVSSRVFILSYGERWEINYKRVIYYYYMYLEYCIVSYSCAACSKVLYN